MKTSAASLLTSVVLGTSTVLGAAVAPIKTRDSKITPVTVKGNAFFKGDERFYIRGLDYQPGGSSKVEDPIAEPEVCKRDVKKFQELGVNTVRIYSVDNSKSHDECMQALADAGIYLILDVNSPKYSINRAEPESSYNDVYLQSVFATVEMFAKYDNTFAFFSGNEVINDGPTSATAPYIKAVTRDIRQYLRKRNLRQVPVGYSAADIDTNRLQMAQYMNCGPESERSDFFAFNDYSYCGSSYETSGWSEKVQKFGDYGQPLFLSEYGCNKNKRDFKEVQDLFSDKMTGVYSGGLVYEYSQEDSNYGLVELKGNDDPKELGDFKALKEAFEKTKNPQGDGGYKKDAKPNECPKKKSPEWDVDGDAKLPAIPEPAKKFMEKGAGDGPGLKGGSQNAGTKSSGTADPDSARVDGASTGGSDSRESEGAAAGLRAPGVGLAPIMCALVVVLSSSFGASLIMF